MSTETIPDGWHRHINPGGIKGGLVQDTATVAATVYVGPNAHVYGTARVYDNARVYGTARVYNNAQVFGNAWVYGTALVYGNARLYGKAQVYSDAHVHGYTRVYGDARVALKAQVSKTEHVITIGPLGNDHTSLTAYRCKKVWRVIGGCSKAVKLGGLNNPDPFLEDYPPKSARVATERRLAINALRLITQVRDKEQENQQ